MTNSKKQNILSKLYKINQENFIDNRALARKAGASTTVVLKNDFNNLPFINNRVAIFGIGSIDTAYTSLGDNYIFNSHNVSIYEGLTNNGVEIINKDYIKSLEKYFKHNLKCDNLNDYLYKGIRNQIDDLIISDKDIINIPNDEQIIYIIRRFPIDDEKIELKKESYLLSDNEENNIKLLTSKFKNVTVILNSYMIDLTSFAENDNIKSILLVGYLGCEIGNAIYDLLFGINTPDGRLTVTVPKSTKEYNINNIYQDDESTNKELEITNDIFVGYRYFESFDGKTLYPFGYGLSYTNFSHEIISISCDTEHLKIKSIVKNIGNYKGRETIQFYVSCFSGLLTKPTIELKAYIKTTLLNPNEEFRTETTINISDLKVYDENNHSYIIEKGRYIIKAGRDAINNSIICAINFDNNAIIDKAKNILECDKNLDTISPSNRSEDIIEFDIPVYNLKTENIKIINLYRKEDNKIEQNQNFNKLLDSLSLESLVDLLIQDNSHYNSILNFKTIKGPTSFFETSTHYTKYGIPNIKFARGTNGVHIPLISTTSFPSINNLGHSFDSELMYDIGYAISKELKYYNFSVLLSINTGLSLNLLSYAPYNYFSEDPLITGILSSSFIKGLESNIGISGCYYISSIKNIFPNTNMPISATERALRDYYFKANEIALKSYSPNLLYIGNEYINGEHLTSNGNFINNLIKKEWDYNNLLISDSSSSSIKGIDIHSGIDFIFGTYPIHFLSDALKNIEPEINGDGTVYKIEQKIDKSLSYKKFEKWNSFKLNKYGEDGFIVKIKDSQFIHSDLEELKMNGYVTIEKSEDNITTIYYRGDKLEEYLSLDDIKRALNSILNFIDKSYSMELYKSKKCIK